MRPGRARVLAGELEPHVPAAGDAPVARYADRSVGPEEAATLATAMPFDVVIGSCNPVAPPIEVSFEQPMAIGRVVFTAPYEGAPGCVHGAVIAGAFDIMLTAANVMAGAAGPTVTLSLRYRKPTVIDQPVRFEAWVTERTDRRTHSRGRLLQGKVVTVEAEASSPPWTGRGSRRCTAGAGGVAGRTGTERTGTERIENHRSGPTR